MIAIIKSDLVGKSLFDFHSPESRGKIETIHARLEAGEGKVLLGVFKGKKITVIGVYGSRGELIGYYERYENTGSTENGASGDNLVFS